MTRVGNLVAKNLKSILIKDFISAKNSYTQNQNIFISGITNTTEESISWELSKI